MNSVLILMALVVFGGVIFVLPTLGPGALAMCLAVSVPTIVLLTRSRLDKLFLIRLFVIGVLVRVILATVINVGHMEEFFGGDANTYDVFGASLNASWHGDMWHRGAYEGFVQGGAGAWGMLYLVASVYEIIGRNMLAIQLINASIGAATAAVIYYVAQQLFENRRVSRISAVMSCFYPSLILWSSQALKDALIVFSLALAILMTLRLMNRVRARDGVVLAACLLAILSLRFYIFYMMVVAVVGAFIIGARSMNAQSFLRRFVTITAIGVTFTMFGIVRFAGSQFQRFGNLQTVQLSRLDAAQSASSGFGKDIDVRTTEGALTVIPIGLVYLLFAPFPWQLASLRQSIALPEMVVWWLSFPFLVLGFWYAMKHRLRQVSPILLFTSMLTLAYSLFQGNVGTAYRQRSQLLVFYFIFVSVGFILTREKAEDARQRQRLAKLQLAEQMAARLRERRKSGTATPVQQS